MIDPPKILESFRKEMVIQRDLEIYLHTPMQYWDEKCLERLRVAYKTITSVPRGEQRLAVIRKIFQLARDEVGA